MLTGSAPQPTVIVVGPSDARDKVIGAQGVMSCTTDGAKSGPITPVNTQNPGWADTFSVVVNGNSMITVHREDSDAGWGQPLEIQCVASQMESLQQLMNMCESLDTRTTLDLVDNLLAACPLVAMDCNGATDCRGGLPLQCAATPGLAGEAQLAEIITVGEELPYTGLCLGSVDGGGWTFVNEQGRSTTDSTDVFPEMLGGYHQFVYDTKGIVFNQVLVHRTSPTWCDSWGHAGHYWGVDGMSTASMGIAMGRTELCYNNGEGGYAWVSVPYCTKSIGGATPDPSCVGGAGVPYAGHVWARADP